MNKDFIIDDDEKAEKVISMIVREKSKMDNLKFQYESMRNDIERRINEIIYLYGNELELYALSKLTGKSRTWKTLSGNVSFRKQSQKMIVDNPMEAMRFCKENNLPFIQNVERLDMDAYLKSAELIESKTDDGEIKFEPSLPGVKLIPESQTMSIGIARHKENIEDETE